MFLRFRNAERGIVLLPCAMRGAERRRLNQEGSRGGNRNKDGEGEPQGRARSVAPLRP